MAKLSDKKILDLLIQGVSESPHLFNRGADVEEYDGWVHKDHDVFRIKVTTAEGCSVSTSIPRPRPASEENIHTAAKYAARTIANALAQLVPNRSKQ